MLSAEAPPPPPLLHFILPGDSGESRARGSPLCGATLQGACVSVVEGLKRASLDDALSPVLVLEVLYLMSRAIISSCSAQVQISAQDPHITMDCVGVAVAAHS